GRHRRISVRHPGGAGRRYTVLEPVENVAAPGGARQGARSDARVAGSQAGACFGAKGVAGVGGTMIVPICFMRAPSGGTPDRRKKELPVPGQVVDPPPPPPERVAPPAQIAPGPPPL